MPFVLGIAIFVLAALCVYLLVPKVKTPRTFLVPFFLTIALGFAVLLVVGYRNWLGLTDVLFGLASITAVFSAIRTVSHPKALYCALYFIVLVFATAVLVLLCGGQFLAAAMAVIYAGAIIVVYLFVIMLAQQPDEPAYPIDPGRVGWAAGAGLVLAGAASFLPPTAGLPAGEWSGSNVAAIGRAVLIDQVVTLEAAGVLLLAGVIGAIAVAKLQSRGGQEDER